MFLGTGSSLKWRRRALVALLLLPIPYAWERSTAAESFAHGGSPIGLVYGYAAALAVAVLVALAVRKRAYRSRLGTLEGWTQCHVYLGLLVLPVALLHSGFRFYDRVALSAFLVMVLVSLSGVAGAILYSLVPRILTEVGGEDLAGLAETLNRLRHSMLQLTKSRSPAFLAMHDYLARNTRPQLLAGWRISGRRIGRLSGAPELRPLLAEVPEEEAAELERLLVLSRQHSEVHRALVIRKRYLNLLQVWLFAHVPLTVLLVVLVAAHVAGAGYFTSIVP